MATSELPTTVQRPVQKPGETAPVACLESMTGPARALHPLGRRPQEIGRDPACAITIDDEGLSRRHAEFFIARDGAPTLVDLDSTNGTKVDGEPVGARVHLQPGSIVDLGGVVRFRFDYFAEAEVDRRRPAVMPLSVRELEVARLVARGLKNQQIADKLGITARTVGAHITNIHRRLDVKTRALIARWIAEQGLDR